jgi:hypothetical protein
VRPIRREVLNGLFVIVLSTLLSAAIAAFQIKFNLQVWVLIVMAVAIAISGYVMFEIALRYMASTEIRETEWLQRVGTPARFEMNQEGTTAGSDLFRDVVKTTSRGSDYTVMFYFDPEQSEGRGMSAEALASRNMTLSVLLEQQKRGAIREYKRIICFDHDVLTNDPELKAGILRVGEGPGTIDRAMGEHCRLMMSTRGCSLFVAPAVVRNTVTLFGSDKVAITVDAAEGGARTFSGTLLFCNPPNGEVIEQFRQIERTTEKRMVAVHKIVFP